MDDFSGILKDPQVTAIFENSILPQAAEYADDNREWAGWIVWSKEEGTPICRSILRPPPRVCSSGRGRSFRKIPISSSMSTAMVQ